MDERACRLQLTDYEIDIGRVSSEAKTRGTDVIGVARFLGETITSVTLKPHTAGHDLFSKHSPPRHGYLAHFTATVSVSSNHSGYVKISDIDVYNVEKGTVVEEREDN